MSNNPFYFCNSNHSSHILTFQQINNNKNKHQWLNKQHDNKEQNTTKVRSSTNSKNIHFVNSKTLCQHIKTNKCTCFLNQQQFLYPTTISQFHHDLFVMKNVMHSNHNFNFVKLVIQYFHFDFQTITYPSLALIFAPTSSKVWTFSIIPFCAAFNKGVQPPLNHNKFKQKQNDCKLNLQTK